MKNRTTYLTLGLITALSLGFILPQNKSSNSQTREVNSGFALVELFTSEGCSSCPPADELISRVQAKIGDQPIYILAFHVDYWNRLGWRDPYSKAEYSERQNKYAKWLNLSSVFTPQLIVNGKTEFIGSEELKLRNAIQSNLNKVNPVHLNLYSSVDPTREINFKYEIAGLSSINYQIIVALVEKNSTSHIKQGENEGKTLNHVQIVRELKIIDLISSFSGQSSIPESQNFNSGKMEIIGFIQNSKTGEILAASKSCFSNLN